MAQQLTPWSHYRGLAAKVGETIDASECLVPYGSIEYGNLMAKVGDMTKIEGAGAGRRRTVRLNTAKA